MASPEIAMDLRKLRYFVTVIDAGGFRRAAEQLNVAQPALTRQVKALEAELGAPLLFRSVAGAALTPQGEIIAREAREILFRADALHDLVLPTGHGVEGEVCLGLPSSLAELILGSIVERLKADHPAVRVICREGAAGLIENVENGSLDLAVVSVSSKRATYRCHVTPLVTEQDYLIRVRRGDLDQASVSIDELCTLPLVLTPSPNARRRHLGQLAHKRGTPLNVVTEAASTSAQLDLVLRGLGSAVLPFSAAKRMMRDGRLEMVPIEGLRSYRVLLTSDKPANTDAVAVVSQEIRRSFSQRAWNSFVSAALSG